LLPLLLLQLLLPKLTTAGRLQAALLLLPKPSSALPQLHALLPCSSWLPCASHKTTDLLAVHNSVAAAVC
jgi:hypothetical protein